MINILFVFGSIFAKGGTEAVMMNIVKYIDKDNFHIDFLIMDNIPDHTEESRYLKKQGTNFYYITRRGVNYRKHIQELNLFFRYHCYDIVHTHMDAIGEEALKFAKRYGVKSRIAHSHSTEQLANPRGIKEFFHRKYLLLEKKLLRKYGTHFIACSPEAGKWLFGDKICKQPNYKLFKNAIDVSKYVFSEDIRRSKRIDLKMCEKDILMHVGRFSYEKNHTFLVEVFSEVVKRKPNTALVLIGAGEGQRVIEQKIDTLDLKNQVVILNNRTDVNELLQAGDIFVFPSKFEGFSVALLEAQATGIPCIASNRISQTSNVSGKVLFLNIDSTPTVWAEAIINILNQNRTRVSPIEKLISAGYDMKTNIAELEDFYKYSLNQP